MPLAIQPFSSSATTSRLRGKEETVEGVLHVYNPAEPGHGTATVELEEIDIVAPPIVEGTSVDAQYVDAMSVGAQARRESTTNTSEVDSHVLLNAKVRYAFEIGDTGLRGEVFVAGENLTDTDYDYLPGYPMPGMSGMAGGSITF